MPKCDMCWDMFPPDFFCERDDDGKECMFCRIGKDYITMDTGKGVRNYTKKECKKDYVEFLRMLKEKEGVIEALVKGKPIE